MAVKGLGSRDVAVTVVTASAAAAVDIFLFACLGDDGLLVAWGTEMRSSSVASCSSNASLASLCHHDVVCVIGPHTVAVPDHWRLSYVLTDQILKTF